MSIKYSIKIAHLFPSSMNIYGDYGNIISLINISKFLGIEASVTNINTSDDLKHLFTHNNHDLIFMGGGQDNNQYYVSSLLSPWKSNIMNYIDTNMPMLLICGAYQLFGQSFLTNMNQSIDGLGVFPIITKASTSRMVGNVTIDSIDFGLCYGFENHSGETFLLSDAKQNSYRPLGTVLVGSGNNHQDKEEGLIYKAVICSYLHGPLLPKNPLISLRLINDALSYKYKDKFDYKISDIKNSALLDKISSARQVMDSIKY